MTGRVTRKVIRGESEEEAACAVCAIEHPIVAGVPELCRPISGGSWRRLGRGLASSQSMANQSEERMALPQDIRPLNSELADSITRSSEIPWIETKPGQAWTKVLWVGPESGRWAVLLKWKKGYAAPPHKHLSAAFAFILSGKILVRDTVYKAGDFLRETNGMVH